MLVWWRFQSGKQEAQIVIADCEKEGRKRFLARLRAIFHHSTGRKVECACRDRYSFGWKCDERLNGNSVMYTKKPFLAQ